MYFKNVLKATILLCIGTTVQASNAEYADNLSVWAALFSLAIVGLIILYFSSRQSSKLQNLHQKMFEKQLEMERNQNQLLTTMSENIHNIAKQALEESHKIMNNSLAKAEHDEEVLANVENRLLDVTNDLIDFLRLKSKKIEIVNEEFNINNVLNEISGSVCSQFMGSNSELIFDIDKNVPRRLVGDSLHLGQILSSILEYQMDQANLSEVKLEISMFDTYADKAEIQFKITDTGLGLTTEALEDLFVPYYNEELGTYVGLGLFVSNELVTMMDGKLAVQSSIGKGSTFTLSLPFNIVDKENKRKYTLPNKALTEKRVFIVDDNYNSALAIKKMFAYFKHDVMVISQEDFRRNIPNLMPFDIVVLHESLFNHRLVEYINKIKMGKELKIIALNSLLLSNKKSFIDEVIDIHLFKPLNQERIFELIVNMYNLQDIVSKDEEEEHPNRVQTHKGHIVETKAITQTKFKDFAGKNILIVEDNLINQKVLTNLLHTSDMEISIANNGQEAVDMVREEKIQFDMILMDINMPIMDGYTATQMIRLDSKFDALPIVAFTALVLDSEIKKMFSAGINAFLAKPLNIGKLYTALAMYLSDAPLPVHSIEEMNPAERVLYKGIDIEEGIKHSNNSEELYLEVLKEFSTAYGSSDTIFSMLIKEHRFEQIRMLCIDMRGLSGAIGAYDMHELVKEILQLLLYKKFDLIANYQAKYVFEIQTLDRSIKKYIADI